MKFAFAPKLFLNFFIMAAAIGAPALSFAAAESTAESASARLVFQPSVEIKHTLTANPDLVTGRINGFKWLAKGEINYKASQPGSVILSFINDDAVRSPYDPSKEKAVYAILDGKNSRKTILVKLSPRSYDEVNTGASFGLPQHKRAVKKTFTESESKLDYYIIIENKKELIADVYPVTVAAYAYND